MRPPRRRMTIERLAARDGGPSPHAPTSDRRMVLDTVPGMAGAIALYRPSGLIDTAAHGNSPGERSVSLERSLSGIRTASL